MAPPLLTAEEFVNRYAGRHAELIEGVVKEYPAPPRAHELIGQEMTFHLDSFVQQRDLGRVTVGDSWVKTKSNPDTVRGGDICYFSYQRWPKVVPVGGLAFSPDLVVVVRAPHFDWRDMLGKAVSYWEANVSAIVALDPSCMVIAVYRPDDAPQLFRCGDDFTLPDVLPGFAVPVSRLFA